MVDIQSVGQALIDHLLVLSKIGVDCIEIKFLHASWNMFLKYKSTGDEMQLLHKWVNFKNTTDSIETIIRVDNALRARFNRRLLTFLEDIFDDGQMTVLEYRMDICQINWK